MGVHKPLPPTPSAFLASRRSRPREAVASRRPQGSGPTSAIVDRRLAAQSPALQPWNRCATSVWRRGPWHPQWAHRSLGFMSKLTAVILTAAICLPLGAVFQGQASADRRKNSLPSDVALRQQAPFPVEDHPHLTRANSALHEALVEVEASKGANEALWSDDTGRADATTKAIENAVTTMQRTSAWVSDGMAQNAQGIGRRRLLVRNRNSAP